MAAPVQAASQVFDFAAEEAQLLRQRQQAASSSSRVRDVGAEKDDAQGTPRRPVSRGKKAVAAVTGAIATSLTMTPFDVIKTRLQTQTSPEPLFLPSQRSLTLVGAPAYPLPAPTATSAPVGLSRALRAAQAHPATCCHATFFTSNADAALACVHDPRIVVGPPGVASSGLPAAMRAAQLRPKRPRAAAGRAKIAPTPPNASTAAACAFPDRGAAARELEHIAGDRRLKGLADGVVKVWRSEGARGLWRGLSPTLLMTVPSQVTYMTCYDVFRSLFLSWERAPPPRDFSSDPLSSITAHSLLSSLAAGGLSRCISATLVTPLELVRTRLQATTPGRSTSLSGLLVSLRGEVSSSGVTVLWRGLSATLWRDVPFSAIYFMGYEGIKRALTGGGLGEGSVQQGKDEFLLAFVAGATSGSAAAVVTHPFDLLKTRQQVTGASTRGRSQDRLSASLRERRPPGMAQALRDIVQREGGAGLFRGLSPRIAKVAPACGIMIASFEVVGRYLEG